MGRMRESSRCRSPGCCRLVSVSIRVLWQFKCTGEHHSWEPLSLNPPAPVVGHSERFYASLPAWGSGPVGGELSSETRPSVLQCAACRWCFQMTVGNRVPTPSTSMHRQKPALQEPGRVPLPEQEQEQALRHQVVVPVGSSLAEVLGAKLHSRQACASPSGAQRRTCGLSSGNASSRQKASVSLLGPNTVSARAKTLSSVLQCARVVCFGDQSRHWSRTSTSMDAWPEGRGD
jgi:hypothetical protein